MQQAGYSDSADKQFTTRAAKFSISFNQAAQYHFMYSPCLPNTIKHPLGPGSVHLFSYKWNICSGPIMLLQYLSTCSVLEKHLLANIPLLPAHTSPASLPSAPLFLLCPHPPLLLAPILPPSLPSSMSGPPNSFLPPSPSLTFL